MKLLSVVDLEKRGPGSQFTWRQRIREGKISSYKVGRLVRVREEDYVSFIEQCRVVNGPVTP